MTEFEGSRRQREEAERVRSNMTELTTIQPMGDQMDAKWQDISAATEEIWRTWDEEEVRIVYSRPELESGRVEVFVLGKGAIEIQHSGRRYVLRVTLERGLHYFQVRERLDSEPGRYKVKLLDTYSSFAMRGELYNVLPRDPLSLKPIECSVLKTKSNVNNFHSTNEWTAVGLENGTALVLDNATKRVMHTLKGHNDFIMSVHISSDSKWLATGSGDKTVKIWEVVSGECKRTLQFGQWVRCVQFSSDCTRIAVCLCDRTVVYECRGDWPQMWSVTGHSDSVWYKLTFARDNSEIAVADKTGVDVLSADNGALIKRLQTAETSSLHDFDYSPSSDLLATCGEYGLLQVFDTVDYKCVATLKDHIHSLNNCRFLDDNVLLSVSDNNTVNIWAARSGLRLATLHRAGVSVSVFPNGTQFATGYRDKTVRFWDFKIFVPMEPTQSSAKALGNEVVTDVPLREDFSEACARLRLAEAKCDTLSAAATARSLRKNLQTATEPILNGVLAAVQSSPEFHSRVVADLTTHTLLQRGDKRSLLRDNVVGEASGWGVHSQLTGKYPAEAQHIADYCTRQLVANMSQESLYLRAIHKIAESFPLIAAECLAHLIESVETITVDPGIIQLAIVGDANTHQFVCDFFAHLCKEESAIWSKVSQWLKSYMESLAAETTEWTAHDCLQLMDELTAAGDGTGIFEALRVAAIVFDEKVGFDEKCSVFGVAETGDKHWAVGRMLPPFVKYTLCVATDKQKYAQRAQFATDYWSHLAQSGRVDELRTFFEPIVGSKANSSLRHTTLKKMAVTCLKNSLKETFGDCIEALQRMAEDTSGVVLSSALTSESSDSPGIALFAFGDFAADIKLKAMESLRELANNSNDIIREKAETLLTKAYRSELMEDTRIAEVVDEFIRDFEVKALTHASVEGMFVDGGVELAKGWRLKREAQSNEAVIGGVATYYLAVVSFVPFCVHFLNRSRKAVSAWIEGVLEKLFKVIMERAPLCTPQTVAGVCTERMLRADSGLTEYWSLNQSFEPIAIFLFAVLYASYGELVWLRFAVSSFTLYSAWFLKKTYSGYLSNRVIDTPVECWLQTMWFVWSELAQLSAFCYLLARLFSYFDEDWEEVFTLKSIVFLYVLGCATPFYFRLIYVPFLVEVIGFAKIHPRNFARVCRLNKDGGNWRALFLSGGNVGELTVVKAANLQRYFGTNLAANIALSADETKDYIPHTLATASVRFQLMNDSFDVALFDCLLLAHKCLASKQPLVFGGEVMDEEFTNQLLEAMATDMPLTDFWGMLWLCNARSVREDATGTMLTLMLALSAAIANGSGLQSFEAVLRQFDAGEFKSETLDLFNADNYATNVKGTFARLQKLKEKDFKFVDAMLEFKAKTALNTATAKLEPMFGEFWRFTDKPLSGGLVTAMKGSDELTQVTKECLAHLSRDDVGRVVGQWLVATLLLCRSAVHFGEDLNYYWTVYPFGNCSFLFGFSDGEVIANADSELQTDAKKYLLKDWVLNRHFEQVSFGDAVTDERCLALNTFLASIKLK